jgi:hypothetical protein
MTTHRHIQIHNLKDSAYANARVYRRAFLNAVSIGNTKAAVRFLERATRLDFIVCACDRRLAT